MIDTQQPIGDITFAAFDVETTGLTPVIDRIVEIGAVKFRGGDVIENLPGACRSLDRILGKKTHPTSYVGWVMDEWN